MFQKEEMMFRKINLIIFSIAVIVFAGSFLMNSGNDPASGRNIQINSHRPSAIASDSRSGPTVPKSGIQTFMGKSQSDILKTLGKPERIDDTKYGYQWFIYGTGSESYCQIGIDQTTHRVTTIYALGKKLPTAPFVIGGQSRTSYNNVPLQNNISLAYKGTDIDFNLSEADMTTRPLIKFGGIWVQLTNDHVTNSLVGVRYMSADVLVRQHPYSMSYLGRLPADPVLSGRDWQAVDQAEDREIFDISNLLRLRFKEQPLKWSDAAYLAAYQHSEEMKQKNYFSHESKWSGDLKTRLEKENILFQLAGENIAAGYPDAIAVTLGWLNSIDHRKNLLNGAFTELGVGSYQNYYTQDFVKPMNP